MLFRFFFMKSLIKGWAGVAYKYCLFTGKTTAEYKEYAVMWPMTDIMIHFWIWDINRFILFPEKAAEIVQFLLGQNKPQK